MSLDPTAFRTLVFDCDGVILDSNRLKTEAFRSAALPYGEEAAEALVRHHLAHGGVSRYEKFRRFLDAIAPPGREGPGYEALLARYAAAVREGLETCACAEGLEALRRATPDAVWMVVSGGDQAELREIFARRGLAGLFDGGIFGSPDAKAEICARETATGGLRAPALFLGDSALDLATARRFGMDFVFVSGWSEWSEGPETARREGLATVEGVAELLGAAR